MNPEQIFEPIANPCPNRLVLFLLGILIHALSQTLGNILTIAAHTCGCLLKAVLHITKPVDQFITDTNLCQLHVHNLTAVQINRASQGINRVTGGSVSLLCVLNGLCLFLLGGCQLTPSHKVIPRAVRQLVRGLGELACGAVIILECLNRIRLRSGEVFVGLDQKLLHCFHLGFLLQGFNELFHLLAGFFHPPCGLVNRQGQPFDVHAVQHVHLDLHKLKLIIGSVCVFVNVKDFRHQLARRRKVRSHTIQIRDVGLHILESFRTAAHCIGTSADDIFHDLKILGRFISRFTSFRNSDELKPDTHHNTDCRTDSRTNGATNHKANASPGKSAPENRHKRPGNVNSALHLMNQPGNHQRHTDTHNSSRNATSQTTNLEANSCSCQRPADCGQNTVPGVDTILKFGDDTCNEE